MEPWFAAGTAEPSSFRQAHWFAEASDISSVDGSKLHASLRDTVWASRIAMSLQAVALPLAFWFKPVCVCLALFWYVALPMRTAFHMIDTGPGSPTEHIGLCTSRSTTSLLSLASIYP